jgi:hypothetical protein
MHTQPVQALSLTNVDAGLLRMLAVQVKLRESATARASERRFLLVGLGLMKEAAGEDACLAQCKQHVWFQAVGSP